jgi:hypothetical protein
MNDEEYMKQGSANLAKYVKEYNAIVKTFPEERRAAIEAMMEGPIGEQFFLAPASSRRIYHNAFPVGLLAHSLNVVHNAWKIADALAPGRWSTDKVSFCALFHDLGKAGSPGKPFYTQTKDKWKFDKGEFWDVSKQEWMPNAEKSLYLLQMHGVKVDWEETVAIRLNDGMGSESNREYSFNEPDLALVVHWADHWAMREEKAADEKVRVKK